MSEETKNFDALKEVTLLLLWLTSFKDEKFGNGNQVRAWKGYDFGILNELLEEKLISGSYKAKSVVLTDEGIKLAEQLQEKYAAALA